MAENTIETLGFRPTAAAELDVYECPTGKEATIHVAWSNEGADTTIYIAVSPLDGSATAAEHYRVGPAYPSFSTDIGEKRSISLVAGQIVRVSSASGDVTFQRSGIERDVAGAVTPTLAVTDGTTTVQPVNTITFTKAASVTDLGGGNAEVNNDDTGGGGGGDNISVNGAAATDADFDDATPAAPAGGVNVKWQKDAGTPNNVSAHLAANDVSNTVLRDSAAQSVIGRANAAGGDPADIVAADETVLGRTGGGVVAFAQVATGQVANNAITDPKLRDSAGFSVIGKATTGSGDPADIVAGNDTVLGKQGAGNVAFTTVATAQIADNAVTDAKLRDSAASSVIGRSAASGGDPADIAGTALQWLRLNGSAVVAFGFDVILSPAQITANQNNYNPGSGHIWRLDSDANRDVTGILAGADGQRLEIVNIGAFTIRLMHQNAGSSAANRLICGGAANISLAPNARGEGWYDTATGRWRMDLV